MTGSSSLLAQIDAQLDRLFAGWNIYTTLIFLIITTILILPVVLSREPDTHPFLLARQSIPSPIRQPGESAIYRSLETPFGYPLRSGLNVKDADAPKWASGKDGDLRDIWRQAVGGTSGIDGIEDGQQGTVSTILGKERMVEHTLDQLSREINAIGTHVMEAKIERLAICLANSAELLVALFAAAFYNFTPIIVPPECSSSLLIKVLRETMADGLVVAAGARSLQDLAQEPTLKKVIWVVEESSRHMGFHEVPAAISSSIEVAVWDTIIEDRKGVSAELPVSGTNVPDILMIWQNSVEEEDSAQGHEVVQFTQKNLVAAVAAQLFALPRTHRLGHRDVMLLLDSISLHYPLLLTLAALFSNASILLNSVAGDNVDLDQALILASPTIVVASSRSLAKSSRSTAEGNSLLQKLRRAIRARTLASGRMPGKLARLRLIYTSDQAGVSSLPLTSHQLSEIRLVKGARTIYALTTSKVAGAVAQSNFYDYRKDEDPEREAAFGPPLSSVEIKLVETGGRKIKDSINPLGWLCVSGPAVVGREVTLNDIMMIRDDNTLSWSY